MGGAMTGCSAVNYRKSRVDRWRGHPAGCATDVVAIRGRQEAGDVKRSGHTPAIRIHLSDRTKNQAGK